MHNSKTLAIMAAGFGSRFGGSKQLQAVSVKGYTIMDYSIFDAISVGFNRIILITREDLLETFKKHYEKMLPSHIAIEFVIQDVKKIPKTYITSRQKPWGTGHALLILKDSIKAPFILINADDFYGRTAFKLMHNALYNSNAKENINYFIGYPVNKTLSKTGSVSRGACFLNENNFLTRIIERTHISKSKNDIISYLNTNKEKKEMPFNSIVSMNFWGFSPDIFLIAEPLFDSFLQNNYEDESNEFYLPEIVDYTIQKKIKSYKMLLTNEQWFGMTYKEDEYIITEKIKQFVKEGLYPENLWKIA